jgi:hypothetical protein
MGRRAGDRAPDLDSAATSEARAAWFICPERDAAEVAVLYGPGRDCLCRH